MVVTETKLKGLGEFIFGKVHEAERARDRVEILITEEWRRKLKERIEVTRRSVCAKIVLEVDKYRIIDAYGQGIENARRERKFLLSIDRSNSMM